MGWAARSNKNPDKGKDKPQRIYRKRVMLDDYASNLAGIMTTIAMLGMKRRRSPYLSGQLPNIPD